MVSTNLQKFTWINGGIYIEWFLETSQITAVKVVLKNLGINLLLQIVRRYSFALKHESKKSLLLRKVYLEIFYKKYHTLYEGIITATTYDMIEIEPTPLFFSHPLRQNHNSYRQVFVVCQDCDQRTSVWHKHCHILKNHCKRLCRLLFKTSTFLRTTRKVKISESDKSNLKNVLWSWSK